MQDKTQKNIKKKVIWAILLVIVIISAVVLAVRLKPRDKSNDNKVTVKKPKAAEENLKKENKESDTEEKKQEEQYNKNKEKEKEKEKPKEEYIRKELEDGILYSKTGEKLKADTVVSTDYYDTTINDMYIYPEKYENKNIEIEGLFLASDNETFVGRISTVTTCPYCAGGFSYIEYKFSGDVKEELKDQDTWIKLVGRWEKEKVNYGTEANPYYDDSYFLKVEAFEVMNEKGQETIKN